MKKLSILLILTILCSMLSGCWDKVEIEERLFVLGIGVDKATEEEKNDPKDRYVVSFMSPIVGALEEGGESTFHTYKTVGDIFTMCLSQMYSRFAKKLSFEHTRVLLFGEDIVKDDGMFKEVLDAVARAHEFHKSMYVFIVPGRAEDAFDVEPKYNKLLAMYITGIADNETYLTRISKMSANEMYGQLDNNHGAAIVPRLTVASDNEVKVSGAAVLKDYKLMGYLSEEENMLLNWVRGESEGGIIRVDYNGVTVPYRYNEFNRKIKLEKVEDGKVYLAYNIDTEGTVEEYIWPEDLLDEKKLKAIEKLVEKSIIEDCEKIIKKFKEEFQMDMLGARDYLRKFQHQIYKQLEKDYEANFKDNIIINVKAEVKIRRVGTIE